MKGDSLKRKGRLKHTLKESMDFPIGHTMTHPHGPLKVEAF